MAERKTSDGAALGNTAKPKRAPSNVEPSAAEIQDARRVILRTLMLDNSHLARESAQDVSQDAIADALAAVAKPTWRGDASFATLALTIARRKAAKLARKEIRQKAGLTDKKPRPRRDLKRSEDAKLGPVFVDFFAHHRMMMRNRRWADSGPGAYLALSIERHLPQFYERHDVPASLRMKLVATGDFVIKVDARMRALLMLTPAGWIQSRDTLDIRPKIPGRPPPDPYLDGSHGPELQSLARDQRDASVGLLFRKKRESVDDAVIRYALELAGLSRSLLNKILARTRSAETKARGVRARRALRRALAAKPDKSKSGS